MSALSKPSDISGILGGTPAPLVTAAQRQAVQDHDHAERREESEEIWAEFLEEDHSDQPTEHLIQYLKDAYYDAKNVRAANGIDCRIQDGRRLFRGEYTPQELELCEGIDVWFHLVSSISYIALAFLRATLHSDTDNPLWELKDTPIPELPEEAIEQAARQAILLIEQEAQLTPGGMSPERVFELLEDYRKDLFDAVDRQAERQTKRLTKKLSDNMTTAEFDQVLDEVLQDYVVDPLAGIYGPVVASKKIPRWKAGKKVWKLEKYQHIESIDVSRLFPSPDSTDTQTGEFIILLGSMTRGDLIDASKLDGFISENIDILLMDFERESRDWLNPLRHSDEIDHEQVGMWKNYEAVDVIKYFGRVPGHVLHHAEIKTVAGKKLDPKDVYEMEIWVCCDQIIRIVDDCGDYLRPIHVAGMYPKPKTFWAESIPHRIKDEQREANVAIRSTIRDMGFTSGPQVEQDVSMLDEGQMPLEQFHAGVVIKTNSRRKGSQGAAIRYNQLKPQGTYFMGLLDKFFLNAEMITGFNRQMLGQAQPGIDTLGEANLLQGNANTSLRSSLVNLDKMLEPMLSMAACQIMNTSDDPTLKSDAELKAKGASHLLTKQLNNQNLLQFFNTMFPLYTSGQPNILEPQGLLCLVRDMAAAHGQDPDKFAADPATVKEREALIQEAVQAGGGAGGIAGGVAQSPQPLDVGAAQPSIAPPL